MGNAALTPSDLTSVKVIVHHPLITVATVVNNPEESWSSLTQRVVELDFIQKAMLVPLLELIHPTPLRAYRFRFGDNRAIIVKPTWNISAEDAYIEVNVTMNPRSDCESWPIPNERILQSIPLYWKKDTLEVRSVLEVDLEFEKIGLIGTNGPFPSLMEKTRVIFCVVHPHGPGYADCYEAEDANEETNKLPMQWICNFTDKNYTEEIFVRANGAAVEAQPDETGLELEQQINGKAILGSKSKTSKTLKGTKINTDSKKRKNKLSKQVNNSSEVNGDSNVNEVTNIENLQKESGQLTSLKKGVTPPDEKSDQAKKDAVRNKKLNKKKESIIINSSSVLDHAESATIISRGTPSAAPEPKAPAATLSEGNATQYDANAFKLFAQEYRPKLMREHPELGPVDFNNILIERYMKLRPMMVNKNQDKAISMDLQGKIQQSGGLHTKSLEQNKGTIPNDKSASNDSKRKRKKKETETPADNISTMAKKRKIEKDDSTPAPSEMLPSTNKNLQGKIKLRSNEKKFLVEKYVNSTTNELNMVSRQGLDGELMISKLTDTVKNLDANDIRKGKMIGQLKVDNEKISSEEHDANYAHLNQKRDGEIKKKDISARDMSLEQQATENVDITKTDKKKRKKGKVETAMPQVINDQINNHDNNDISGSSFLKAGFLQNNYCEATESRDENHGVNFKSTENELKISTSKKDKIVDISPNSTKSNKSTKTKAIKDPDRPKKTNIFHVWTDANRQRIIDETGLHGKDLVAKLTEVYKQLDSDGKMFYKGLADKANAQYKIDMEEYKKKKENT